MLKSDFSVMTEKTQIVKQNEFCKKTTEMWFFCWKEDTYNSQDTQFMHIILNFLIDRMMRGGGYSLNVIFIGKLTERQGRKTTGSSIRE